MTSLAGKALQDRLQAYGLIPLYQLFQEVAVNPAAWPGTATITLPDPSHLEYVRNLLYSALWETGIKPQFTVRKTPGREIQIEQKITARQASGISFGQPGQPGPGPGQYDRSREHDVLGDEGLRELLADTSKPDWLSRPDASTPTQETGLKSGFTLPTGKPLGHSNLLADQPADEDRGEE